jgi:hypothetical protein
VVEWIEANDHRRASALARGVARRLLLDDCGAASAAASGDMGMAVGVPGGTSRL